jgi:hypothetical protein
MHSQRSRFAASIVCAACIVSGCASVPEEEIEQRVAEVRLYKSSELAGTAYDSVGHIWVDSWRTAFWPPTYPTLEEAVRAARAEAARLGANGLVNTVCLDQSRGQLFGNDELAILCYGNAVRIRGSAG